MYRKIIENEVFFVKIYLILVTTSSSLPPSDCTGESQTKLRLVYPLESFYRARYKSDYFPQNGIVRKPRYIADSAGNHFITLQVKIMIEKKQR